LGFGLPHEGKRPARSRIGTSLSETACMDRAGHRRSTDVGSGYRGQTQCWI